MEGLGATRWDHQQERGHDFWVLRDPWSNEFCVLQPEFPELLANAATHLSPHDLTFYLRDLAASFHSYYAAERFLADDAELTRARLALLVATRQVIRNALAVLGVSAPERMERDNESSPRLPAQSPSP